MRIHPLRLLLCSLLALTLTPAAPAQPAPGELEASLTAVTRVVAAGAPAELTLRVKALQDTTVDATVLCGVHLTRTVDGGQEVTLGGKEAGTVKLGAGGSIERALKVNLEVVVDPKASALTRVAVRWPGLPGAETTLLVAPAQDFDVEQLDLGKTRVLLATSHGTLQLGFFADKAPNHVKNFVKLSKSGFYNGTRFHRIIRGFMIQGGCPNTKAGATGQPGSGTPGYTVDAEFNDTRHVKGILSAARTNDPNSAGCQFFICHGDASFLDKKYTAFGKLLEGEDVLDKIADVPVRVENGEASVPTVPVHLHQAIVLPVFKETR